MPRGVRRRQRCRKARTFSPQRALAKPGGRPVRRDRCLRARVMPSAAERGGRAGEGAPNRRSDIYTQRSARRNRVHSVRRPVVEPVQIDVIGDARTSLAGARDRADAAPARPLGETPSADLCEAGNEGRGSREDDTPWPRVIATRPQRGHATLPSTASRGCRLSCEADSTASVGLRTVGQGTSAVSGARLSDRVRPAAPQRSQRAAGA